METERQSSALLTPPDPVDHYAELLRIRQKSTRRDYLLAHAGGAVVLVCGMLLNLEHIKEFFPWFSGSILLVIFLVSAAMRRSEYEMRDELLKLLEVLHRAEKDAQKEP